jgi:NACHT domain
MLASLRLEETALRHDQIESTYSQTFNWIFQEPRLKFQRWIQGESGIYWIRGKPGSGKSTLMKFLHADDRTREYMNNQTDGSWVASVWFFFYGRGSRIQKSFEGLLYSILHQVISQKEQLAQLILPLYTQMTEVQRKYWSLRDLKEAFDLIKNQITFPLRLYLFLDALDEYEGEFEMIVDFLKSITTDSPQSMTKINVCFSSRPWNVFVEEFDSCPGFSIHEWTQEDIRTFTRGRLMEQRSMRELLTSHPDTREPGRLDLLSTIVTRASGVFLWVRLVVNELLRARKDGASPKELMGIVLETPTELEDYYNNIMQQLPLRYRLEGFIIFEILVRSNRALRLRQLARAIDSALCDTLQRSITELERGANSSAPLNDLLRRLQSRCGGLVEVVNGGANPFVQFMHQTVKELVGKPGFHNLILGRHISPLRQNGHSFLFKAHATSLSLLAETALVYRYGTQLLTSHIMDLSQFAITDSPILSTAWEEMSLHARLSESTTGFSQKDFLDSINDDIVQSWRASCRGELNGPPDLQTVMSFAVWADLRLYVKDRANLIHGDPQMPLLHVVVSRTVTSDGLSEHESVSLGPMCRLLLSLGVDQDVLVGEQTAFQALIEKSYLGSVRDSQGLVDLVYTSPYPVGDSQRVIDLVYAFLENGQDPNMNLPRTYKSKRLHTCKAIHLSLPRVTKAFLAHGANVNALTSKGHTALDLSIRSTVKFASLDQFGNAIEKAMLLLNHGACLSEHGKRYLAQLILHRRVGKCPRDSYSAVVYDLCERLRTVQYLPGSRYPAYTSTAHLNEWPAEIIEEVIEEFHDGARSPTTIAKCEAFEKALAAINDAYTGPSSGSDAGADYVKEIRPTVIHADLWTDSSVCASQVGSEDNVLVLDLSEDHMLI